MNMKAKVAITLLVLSGGIGYTIYSTIQSGEALEYFKHVDEVVASSRQWEGQHLQLHGNVVAGSILKKANALDYKFALHRKGQWIDISYTGIVPDTFRDCAELVVKGKFLGNRQFKAETISAKCPSKYDGKRDTGCGQKLQPQVLSYRQKQ